MTSTTIGTRNQHQFTVGADLHRRSFASDSREGVSGGMSVVVLEHATKSRAAFDSGSDGFWIIDWLNHLIVQSLMVSFGVVMLDVFTHGVLQ